MNLASFAHVLLRRGWMAVLLAVAFAAAGYAYAMTRTPVYEASTPVKVQPARPADLGQTQAIKEMMRSYQQDIRTFDMAETVLARLCGDTGDVAARLCASRDPGSLRGAIYVGSDPNVFEVQIKARAEDPAEAVKISEQTAHAFVDQREKANLQIDMNDWVVAEVRDAPEPHLYSPRKKLLVGFAGALGLALGAALMLLLEYLERAVVRDRGDAERLLGATVMASVPPSGRELAGGGAMVRGAREAAAGGVRGARRLWPVVGLAVLGALAAAAFSYAQPTEYVARTRIAIEPALGSDWGRSQAIREIARGFSRDIHTRRMAQVVSERMQLDEPAGSLLERTNVAEDVDVYEITVEVVDGNVDVAADISRAWSELFVEERRTANLKLDQPDRILTRLRDRTLTELWAPKTSTNVLAGAVLGALIGAGLVYLLHLLGAGVIRSAVDADRAASAPLLGAIPPERQSRSGGTRP